jgi:hypothetical protein
MSEAAAGAAGGAGTSTTGGRVADTENNGSGKEGAAGAAIGLAAATGTAGARSSAAEASGLAPDSIMGPLPNNSQSLDTFGYTSNTLHIRSNPGLFRSSTKCCITVAVLSSDIAKAFLLIPSCWISCEKRCPTDDSAIAPNVILCKCKRASRINFRLALLVSLACGRQAYLRSPLNLL